MIFPRIEREKRERERKRERGESYFFGPRWILFPILKAFFEQIKLTPPRHKRERVGHLTCLYKVAKKEIHENKK